MSLPDRNNPYSFEAFINVLHSLDFYSDDPFLQKTLKYFAGEEFAELDRKLRDFSPKVSFLRTPFNSMKNVDSRLRSVFFYA